MRYNFEKPTGNVYSMNELKALMEFINNYNDLKATNGNELNIRAGLVATGKFGDDNAVLEKIRATKMFCGGDIPSKDQCAELLVQYNAYANAKLAQAKKAAEEAKSQEMTYEVPAGPGGAPVSLSAEEMKKQGKKQSRRFTRLYITRFLSVLGFAVVGAWAVPLLATMLIGSTAAVSTIAAITTVASIVGAIGGGILGNRLFNTFGKAKLEEARRFKRVYDDNSASIEKQVQNSREKQNEYERMLKEFGFENSPEQDLTNVANQYGIDLNYTADQPSAQTAQPTNSPVEIGSERPAVESDANEDSGPERTMEQQEETKSEEIKPEEPVVEAPKTGAEFGPDEGEDIPDGGEIKPTDDDSKLKKYEAPNSIYYKPHTWGLAPKDDINEPGDPVEKTVLSEADENKRTALLEKVEKLRSELSQTKKYLKVNEFYGIKDAKAEMEKLAKAQEWIEKCESRESLDELEKMYDATEAYYYKLVAKNRPAKAIRGCEAVLASLNIEGGIDLLKAKEEFTNGGCGITRETKLGRAITNNMFYEKANELVDRYKTYNVEGRVQEAYSRTDGESLSYHDASEEVNPTLLNEVLKAYSRRISADKENRPEVENESSMKIKNRIVRNFKGQRKTSGALTYAELKELDKIVRGEMALQSKTIAGDVEEENEM